MKIGILDYNACNIKSVYNAVYRLGYNPHVIENYSEIKEQDKLIIPGVGSAFKTVDYLKKKIYLIVSTSLLINQNQQWVYV